MASSWRHLTLQKIKMAEEGLIVGGMSISDMRVSDLKVELGKRNLSKSGTKKQLLERLRTVKYEVLS